MKKFAIQMVLVAAAVMFGATGCSIKIYRVDQQTVLEDEAAGEWPEFEREILAKSQSSAPTPFATVAESQRKARLFNVLNSLDRPAAVASGAAQAAKPLPGGTQASGGAR
jgi:hypothetical protein